MPRATLLHQFLLQFLDSSGNPYSSGTLSFYAPGTTTLKAIYTDSSKSVQLSNPISLDAGGFPVVSSTYVQIWLDGAYRIKLKNSSGTTIRDLDNITSLGMVNTVVTKTSNYIAVAADKDTIILSDATSGNMTVTLPSITTVGSGYILYV